MEEIKNIQEIKEVQSEEITKQQKIIQKEVISYYKPQVLVYFNSKNNPSNMIANQFIEQSFHKMKNCIEVGLIDIPKKKKIFDQLIATQNINKQEEKTINMKSKKHRLEIQIQMLEKQLYQKEQQEKIKNQIKSKSKSKSRQKNCSVQVSDEEHKLFIKKIFRQRKSLEKKRKIHLQQIEKKKFEEIQQEQKKQKQVENKLKQEKLKQIKEKLEIQKRNKQKEFEQKEEADKRLKSVQNKKRMYEILEQKYHNSFVLPMIEERNKKLNEIKEFHQEFNIESIKKHQKSYLQKIQDSNLSQKNRQKSEWNYKMPVKSQKLIKMLEEEKIYAKIKLEQKKRMLQQKISRQQNFVQYLKQKFPIVIDEKKRQEVQAILVRDKLKQSKKVEIDVFKMGNNYLQESKKRIRKNRDDNESNFSSYKSNKQAYELDKSERKKANNTSMSHYKSDVQYEEIKRKRMERIISSEDMNKHEKLQQLRIQANLFTEKIKRQEEISKAHQSTLEEDNSIDTLVSSIKAKMGIIEVYKQQ